MAKMAPSLVEHVVADAGAFLLNAALQEIGKNIYTVKEVVSEIRDKETRRRLAVLPYELHFKEPFPENIKLVTEFSKKTGDYTSLSATDIKVLALTYQLEAEHAGVHHIRKESELKVTTSSTLQHSETPVNIAGFHLPSKPQNKNLTKKITKPASASEGEHSVANAENPEFGSFLYWRDPLPSIEEDLQELLSLYTVTAEIHRMHQPETHCASIDLNNAVTEGMRDSATGSEEEDDGEGWITPSNIKQVQQDFGCWELPNNIKVGCLTTDFAMQNVLLQMGLHVLEVNGMQIRQTRNYILRCHGCFRTTSDMTKVFCPTCGNKTLKKVAVTVNEDGSLHMHFSRNQKVLNPRGLKYSLPTPAGGKHGSNPHLVSDQHFPQQRLSKKARQRTNVFEPNYTAGISPFTENDIYSRAANLHIRDGAVGGGQRRLNPNSNRKGTKKR
ncbi:RNA-binding protein NOB1 [Rhinatrema bivittatum]|uniref:RNA-binding protein NOB1 n=1 Tax=Rhinatrema bivittatum TaxID=194408 RepID=UPI0011267D7C|nr:RNA-binding protein NOB1 [Rhinatrema bivittatum]